MTTRAMDLVVIDAAAVDVAGAEAAGEGAAAAEGPAETGILAIMKMVFIISTNYW